MPNLILGEKVIHNGFISLSNFYLDLICLGLTDDQKAAFEREDLLFERKHVRINKIH